MRDWLDGLAHLLAGREWHGPAYRAAKAKYDAERQAGLELQAQARALGAEVSLEVCRDMAKNGLGQGLLDAIRRRS